MREHRIHQIFEASLLLKGLHALVECISGVALAFVSTKTITGLVNLLTQNELAEDPRDFVASHLMAWAQGFSVGTKSFYVFYLLSHGIVKIALVVALLRGRLWAYPASLVVLGLFILYQIYRFSQTLEPGLVILTVFDVVVMWLIWHECRLVKQHRDGTIDPARYLT